MKSQNAEILDYLKTGKSLTAQQAIHNMRVFRLAARIADLRGSGYPIATETIKRRNKRSGRVISYASYSLAGANQ